MIKTVVLLAALLIISNSLSCGCSHKQKKAQGKSGICILHPDNNSGVRGIVMIYQENEFAPAYF
jgi:hypothetical protein